MTGEIFDPEIHATDDQGNPSTNKDGSLRKKRADAGQRKGPTSARRTTTTRAGGSKRTDPRAQHHKSVTDLLAMPAAVASLADPVVGYVASGLAPMWADALADLAVENPRMAAALERAGSLGAVGGVITAAVVTGVQMGHLFGRVPGHIVKMTGGQTREEIEQILTQRGEMMARQGGGKDAESPEATGAAARGEAVSA
ncbi:hypothetical protein [Streptomyces sp. NPDC087787]|uniref:hypothetical protein n=1 Tax=Streptomyces sp. NPDC087787 TaxID=3365803 RepID=UPI0037FC3B1C